jgi:tetratricopeptide (TPR) repeat protein
MQAIELFREREDHSGFGRAVLEAAQVASPAQRLAGLLEEAAAGVEGRDDALWTQLVACIGLNANGYNRTAGVTLPAGYEASHERALQLARAKGLAGPESWLLAERCVRNSDAYRFEEAVTDYAAAEALSRVSGTSLPLAPGPAMAMAALGDLGGARDQNEMWARSYLSRGNRRGSDTARGNLVALAVNRGQFAAVDAVADELRSSVSASAALPLAMRLLLGGDVLGALDVLPPIAMVGGVPHFVAFLSSVRTHVLAAVGRETEASAELQVWREAVNAMGLFEQTSPAFLPFAVALWGMSGPPVNMLEERDGRWMYTALTVGAGATVQSNSIGLFRGIDTLRGELALRFGELDSAERWFRHGIEFGQKWELMLEVGCCLQGLAEVAERRGNHLEAMQHLDAAGEIYAKHGVKLYLDQVLAKKQLLKA